MTQAFCITCGFEKRGPFSVCPKCKSFPTTEEERALSLVFSKHLSSNSQLVYLSNAIQNNEPVSPPPNLLAQARSALKDPQLIAMLTFGNDAKQVSRPVLSTPPPIPHKPMVRKPHKLETTALHKNAFYILGASTRDDGRKIVALAEERALELDQDICQKARMELSNPRKRIGAEMAWLPGVSPGKANQLVARLLQDPMSIRTESGLPSLADANLTAAAFEAVGKEDTPEDIAEFIQELALLADDLSVDDILRDINEDRAISGFSEIRAPDQVEAELVERKRYYRNTIKDSLNRLPPSAIVRAMTLAVESATGGGEFHAPALIDELVDSYEGESQGFLKGEAENIQKLLAAILVAAKGGEAGVKPLISKLDGVVRNWNSVASPIQLSAKARGISHGPSHEIAYSIRSVSIDLFNEYDMVPQTKRLIALLEELFAALPQVAERVGEDSDAVERILKDQKNAAAKQEEWARELTYSAEIGLVFKDRLSISPDGLSWKDKIYPLKAITQVRWGGVSHSINGVPSGTTYTIAFGDRSRVSVVELKRKEVYSEFVDRLWRAVCVRLLTELLEALKAGHTLSFGSIALRDAGVTLTRHKFIAADETVGCTWSQVNIWNADGEFCIGLKDDRKTYGSASYINTPNTHILEQAIRLGFKRPGMTKLSEIIESA